MTVESQLKPGDEANGYDLEGPSTQVRIPGAGPARRPDCISESEAEALKARAAEIVERLAQASGSAELQLLDSFAVVGVEAQQRASGELDFLRTQVGEMLGDGGPAGEVTRDLVDLRVALDRISPSEHGTRGGLRRIIPFSGGMLDRLQRIAIRYETVSRQVVSIEQRLDQGRVVLRRDNVLLRKLYEDVEAHQLHIERNAYLGEALLVGLEALLARTQDPWKRERVQTAIFDVATRVQDLRTMQEVHTQFFVSIEMTRVNNSRLAQAVDRTLSMATNTLMVGLAIQTALARQKRVLQATERTRQFLGDLMAANAAAIRQHSTEIGDVYTNPVVALDKLTQAHQDLVEAMNTAARVEAEGMQAARANIEKLRQMTEELAVRSPGQPALPTEPIEA